MLAAKSAVPNATWGSFHWPPFEKKVTAGISLFTSSAGYFSDECLAEALRQQGKPMLWLRVAEEERDPATLLLSIIESARRLQPGIGGITLEKMKLNPGPLMGWPALYTLLAQELADGLPTSSAIVLEHVHHLAAAQPTLELLTNHLLVRLPASLTQILTTHQNLPASAIPSHANYYSTKDLRIDLQRSLALAEAHHSNLPKECLRRALILLDGRGVALAGLLASCQELGPDFMQGVVLRSKNADQLLKQLVHVVLSGAGAQEIRALMLGLQLDYCHPELSRAALGAPALPHGPWVQPLSDGWSRLRSTWQVPLRAASRAEQREMDNANLVSLTEYLARQGAIGKAVELCFTNSYYPVAARLMANTAEAMMDLGQWATLEGWLKQMPDDALQEWPGLVYIQGEIAAARGRVTEARRTFALSSALFSARGEPEKACKSLLAESTLAEWRGEKGRAQGYAQSASDLARQAGLSDPLGHANWQLASLAAAADKLDEALAYLAQAADTLTDPSLAALFHRTAQLLQNQLDLQGQRKSRYQAYLTTVQAEQDNLESLQHLMNSPAPNLPKVLARRGWSNTPLTLKMPAPVQSPVYAEAETRPNFLKRLLQALSLRQLVEAPSDAGEFIGLIAGDFISAGGTIPAQLETIQPTSVSQPVTSEAVAVPDLPAQAGQPAAEMLSAYLLGSFRLSINETPLTKLPSNRGLAVFKYMLMHRTQSIAREVLMDKFWPDADPYSARNSLHVALHSLRKALGSIIPLPVILFKNGKYCLNPDLQVWVDVEEFEKRQKDAKRYEGAGQVTEAVREYEAAISLYQGDLLADDPYEEWPVLEREHLRITHLELLDRLSQIYFNQDQYLACIALCQRILEQDSCREDAHRRLMRCYNRQGQQHLALRQYHACVEMLHKELDVEPAAATVLLYQSIHSQEFA